MYRVTGQEGRIRQPIDLWSQLDIWSIEYSPCNDEIIYTQEPPYKLKHALPLILIHIHVSLCMHCLVLAGRYKLRLCVSERTRFGEKNQWMKQPTTTILGTPRMGKGEWVVGKRVPFVCRNKKRGRFRQEVSRGDTTIDPVCVLWTPEILKRRCADRPSLFHNPKGLTMIMMMKLGPAGNQVVLLTMSSS